MAIIDEDKKKNDEVVGGNFKGVDDATMDKIKPQSFTESDKVTELDKQTQDAHSNLGALTSKDKLISDDTMATINSSFKTPTAVKQADKWLSNQLSIIQSGKTSYSDQVRDMMDKIMGREKFSYDVDKDPLFQQALASSMNAGKQAMQDTIGQASALTGGYGSTYATSAGNQAYNAFIEDAYDNLPQYYQMALEAYQMEGDEMYRQYGMLSAEDDKEYNRNVTAYDATYQHRNQMYNEAYGQFRDAKSDAFASANLQLNEHGQRVNDAYNYYNATSNQADKMYEREYSKWADEINMAYKYADMLNTDYWNQTNFDEGVRQYEQNFAEEQRQFNESYAQTEKWNQADLDYKNQALAQDQSQFDASMAEDKRQFDATMAYNKSKGSGGGGGNPSGGKSPTQTMMANALKAYNEGGTKGLRTYLGSIPDEYDISGITDYVAEYGEDWVTDYDNYSGWTISDDTNNGWWIFGKGEDHNDVYSNGTETKTYDDLKKEINASNLPPEKKEELLKNLQKQSKK